MNFPEQPPSKQWAALKFKGEKFAEVWFKPDSQPFALTFRIPEGSFQVPGISELLTAENLLLAVGVATADVESWRREGAPSEPDSHLGDPLSPPQDAAHLTLHFRLKPPAQADDLRGEGGETAVPEAKWQELEARWKAVLDWEAGINTLRIGMEGLRSEMEAASRRTLTPDEKVHASNADVAQWNKAKSRVHYAMPKVKEFIHRATWAAGAPERKKLEELFKSHIQPRRPFPEMARTAERLDDLLKDRQVLSAQGTTVYQECKCVAAEVQGALRNLQSNAAANAVRQRGATVAKGKFF